MAEHHSLRAAGGAGRVDDCREVIGLRGYCTSVASEGVVVLADYRKVLYIKNKREFLYQFRRNFMEKFL